MLKFAEWLANEVTAYHWTTDEDGFGEFGDGHLGSNNEGVPSSAMGHWFSLDKSEADDYFNTNGYGRVITANLNVYNLYNMSEDDFYDYDSGGSNKTFQDANQLKQQLISQGYDGIKVGGWVCVFDPSKIRIIN